MSDSNRGLISYKDNPSVVEDFWNLVPGLSSLWKPEEYTEPDILQEVITKYLKQVDTLKDKHYLVYVHILSDNSVYVGMTGTSMQRRAGSTGSAYKDTLYNDFYIHMQELGGWDNAKHYTLVQGLYYDQAIAYEELFTRLFEDAGYCIFNRKYGCKGHRHTAETRQKIGEAGIGRRLSIESKQKISKANKGRVRSQETIAKHKASLALYWADAEHHQLHRDRCSEGNRNRQCGKHLSESTKQKLRCARIGTHISDEWRKHLSESHKGIMPNNAKIIVATLPDGSVLEFPSGSSCAEYFGKTHDWANRYCRIGKSTPEGISFRYKEIQ